MTKYDTNLKDIYPSEFVSFSDLKEGQEVERVVEDVAEEEVFNPRTNKKEMKWTLRLHGAQKKIVLNKTSKRIFQKTYKTIGELREKTVIVYRGKVNGKNALLMKPKGN